MDRTTELLSTYTCDLTYEQLPADAVHQVKRTLIDSAGCLIGGLQAEPARIARHLAQTVTCTTPSRLLGTAQSSSPDMAGFANGVALRYLDYNDSYFSPGGGHPSDMIPAVLALADPLQCDGRTVITAIVVAYEVFCRLSDHVVIGPLGWDQGMLGVIGAVCGAGKVLGLERDDLAQAIALASVSNLPLGAIRVGELSMWKGCAAAYATRAAIFSVQLAKQGMTGPDAPLDGRRGLWQQAVDEPVEIPPFDPAADGFRILSTIFKSYPSQIHTQGPIGLALELRQQVQPHEIAAIHLRTYETAASSAATEPEKWAPKTRETADHSIPYLVAYALQHGMVTPHSFTDAYLQDPDVRSLIATMTIEEEPGFTQRFSDEYNCQMDVTTTSGQRVSAAVAHPRGHFRNPMSDADVEAKFRRLAADIMSPEHMDRALALLWSLEDAENLKACFDALIVA
ncbi:MmgE/PrpD family protein [Candidatus Entotheonella palauensis]|uniref:MmgE/PrpD family protein n=1 Tax=Candidatus Entotheonella palauensis TaxID=93172 RepID=UPI0015C42A36|nr:MmgE/PrpD family protein [Candidatus Entotheonella palauensis]